MANGLNSSGTKRTKYTGSGVLAVEKSGGPNTGELPVPAPARPGSPNTSRGKMPVSKVSLHDILALLQDDLATLQGMGVKIAAGYNEGKLAFILSIESHDLDFRDGEILFDGVPVLDK